MDKGSFLEENLVQKSCHRLTPAASTRRRQGFGWQASFLKTKMQDIRQSMK
jgi:hypothetical protein